MGREEFEVIRKDVVRRKTKRRVGLFIDSTGLDRATRRMERKVDLSRLVSGLAAGIQIEVARYYTLIPYEDDARQLSFLDAVDRAGLEVVTKRLPPKGVKRQVSMDVHIAADILNFAHNQFSAKPVTAVGSQELSVANGAPIDVDSPPPTTSQRAPMPPGSPDIKRIAIIVCPSREISYALHSGYEQGLETVLADFGLYGQSDGWRGVDRWIDLSASETIWRG